MERKALRELQALEVQALRLLRSMTLTEFQSARLEALIASLREMTRATYASIYASSSDDLLRLSSLQTSWTSNALVAATGLPGRFVRTAAIPAAEVLRIRGAPLTDWLGRQAQGTVDRFTDAVRFSAAAGETMQEAAHRARDIFNVSRSQARAIVRTGVQTVSNRAYEETWKVNNSIVSSVLWTSTLDGDTTLLCAVRDGLEYTHDGEPVGHGEPWLGGPGQAHWQCRSVARPKLVSWRELGIPIDDIPESTRASMTGQVPASMKFEQWLRTKGKTFQDEYLGKKRAALWRGHRVSFRDLVNSSGRPITVEDL